MNWYRKIAVIVEDTTGKDYLGIGHCNYYNGNKSEFCPGGMPEVEEIWLIDQNLQLHSLPAGPDVGHGEDTFPSYGKHFATGRYVRDALRPQGECSAVIKDDSPTWNPRRRDFQKSRVSRILERKYGPQCSIIFFDKNT
jgi:hypothetical protein